MKLSKDVKNELKNVLKEKLSHKEMRATIVAPYELSRKEVDSIQKKVPLITHLPVDVTVDESLMAGFMIRVGSKLIDYSLKTKIDSLFT